MITILKKIKYFIFHPFHCIKVFIYKRHLKYIGDNVLFGHGISISNPSKVCIGDNTEFATNCIIMPIDKYSNTLYVDNNIIIGNDVYFSSNVFISCINKIVISDGVLVGNNTYISDNSHGDISNIKLNDTPYKRQLFSKGSVHIGKNVWIGRNVCVLPNVTIGDYAIIGANAVVTHDIPAYAIAAGVPAKVIKMIK